MWARAIPGQKVGSFLLTRNGDEAKALHPSVANRTPVLRPEMDWERDLILVFHARAYGLTTNPTAFLSHPAPVEI